ncbi:MAG: hypothetical protein HZA19_05765 [Nitrospirae bacterium]|nr:hypothetical protein [Nitrospirota bacterium]
MFQDLPDGIVAYIWAGFGGVVLVVVALLIWWCSKTGQFDEKIKHQIFTEGDDDRFTKNR